MLFQQTIEWKGSKEKYKNILALYLIFGKQWNRKVFGITLIVGALGTVHTGAGKIHAELDNRGRNENIWKTKLIKPAKIQRSV